MRCLFLLLLSMAFACGDDSPPSDGGADSAADAPVDATLPETARIEIGTGLTEFIEVPDGGDTELVAGPQGGWHVDIALRLYDLEPEGLFLRIEGEDADTAERVAIPIERVLTARRVRPQGDHLLRLGDQLVMTITMPSEVVDRDIRIRLVARPEGVSGEVMAERVFHIIDEVEE